jgi:hypothetical protein
LTESLESQHRRLEETTVEAQRTYIAALVAWERAEHRKMCPICGPAEGSPGDRALACEAARNHKEQCRRAFSDLCDALGYIPEGHGVGLPDEEHFHSCAKQIFRG